MPNTPPVPIGPLKTRARVLSLRFFWRLLAAALALYIFQYVLNLAVSLVDFAIFGQTTEVSLFGIQVSVSYELLRLAAAFLWAPLALGVSAFFLGAARGDPGKFADIFSWFGDAQKRRISMKFGLFQVVFGLFTFPLGSLPLYYLNDKLLEFMQLAQTSLTLDSSLFATREVYMAMVLLLLYALVSLPFVALPYVLCDLYRHGFMKSLRYSSRLMLNFAPRFILFILSFALWFLLGSFFVFLLLFLFVYFRVALVSMIDYLRVGISREPYYAERSND